MKSEQVKASVLTLRRKVLIYPGIGNVIREWHDQGQMHEKERYCDQSEAYQEWLGNIAAGRIVIKPAIRHTVRYRVKEIQELGGAISILAHSMYLAKGKDYHRAFDGATLLLEHYWKTWRELEKLVTSTERGVTVI